MYKKYTYLVMLGLFVSMVQAVDHNFQIKNNTSRTIYVMLGDKSADPINRINVDSSGKSNMIQVPSGKSAGTKLDMSKYPEILVAKVPPVRGSRLYLYKLNPYAVQGQDLKKKQMLIEVVDTHLPANPYETTYLNQGKSSAVPGTYMVAKPQTGFLGRSISNNITEKELEFDTAIYRATKYSNPTREAYQLLPVLNNKEVVEGEGGEYNPSSSPYDILNIPPGSSASRAAEARLRTLRNAEYLRQHVDTIPVYKAVEDITNKALAAIVK